MWALVLLELELELVVWLAVSVFVIQLSMLANCSLVLLLYQSFDHEQVEKLDLLVARLVVRAFLLQLKDLRVGQWAKPYIELHKKTQ